jgi:hypothetical protein
MDAFPILREVTVAATSEVDAGNPPFRALETCLDLYERIVFPMLDGRCGVDGCRIATAGAARHQRIMELVAAPPPEGVDDEVWLRELRWAVHDHAALSEREVSITLRRCLDATELDDLGDALEAARQSSHLTDPALPPRSVTRNAS